MKKLLFLMALFTISVTPALAVFTDTFETNPFGASGNWNRSGNVSWTGGGTGNDFVNLGQSRNIDNRIWQSFTVNSTGNYNVSFDYRFAGIDLNRRLDDKVSVQIGTGQNQVFSVFDAVSSTGLTGGLRDPGSWRSITASTTLEAGKQYWLSFDLKEASARHRHSPVTYLNLDNVGIESAISSYNVVVPPDNTPVVSSDDKDKTSGPPAVPAPGAILLGSIGVSIVGWLRRRRQF